MCQNIRMIIFLSRLDTYFEQQKFESLSHSIESWLAYRNPCNDLLDCGPQRCYWVPTTHSSNFHKDIPDQTSPTVFKSNFALENDYFPTPEASPKIPSWKRSVIRFTLMKKAKISGGQRASTLGPGYQGLLPKTRKQSPKTFPHSLFPQVKGRSLA